MKLFPYSRSSRTVTLTGDQIHELTIALDMRRAGLQRRALQTTAVQELEAHTLHLKELDQLNDILNA